MVITYDVKLCGEKLKSLTVNVEGEYEKNSGEIEGYLKEFQ
jgi:hypothetical protein